jgi:hypothetical protein
MGKKWGKNGEKMGKKWGKNGEKMGKKGNPFLILFIIYYLLKQYTLKQFHTIYIIIIVVLYIF